MHGRAAPGSPASPARWSGAECAPQSPAARQHPAAWSVEALAAAVAGLGTSSGARRRLRRLAGVGHQELLRGVHLQPEQRPRKMQQRLQFQRGVALLQIVPVAQQKVPVRSASTGSAHGRERSTAPRPRRAPVGSDSTRARIWRSSSAARASRRISPGARKVNSSRFSSRKSSETRLLRCAQVKASWTRKSPAAPREWQTRGAGRAGWKTGREAHASRLAG